MEIKAFEVRDRATFIPVIAIRLNPACEDERYLISRAGYGEYPATQTKYIAIGRLSDLDLKLPINWSFQRDRTMRTAHGYIEENWDSLWTGAVIDVEFILGETDKPKYSERIG